MASEGRPLLQFVATKVSVKSGYNVESIENARVLAYDRFLTWGDVNPGQVSYDDITDCTAVTNSIRLIMTIDSYLRGQSLQGQIEIIVLPSDDTKIYEKVSEIVRLLELLLTIDHGRPFGPNFPLATEDEVYKSIGLLINDDHYEDTIDKICIMSLLNESYALNHLHILQEVAYPWLSKPNCPAERLTQIINTLKCILPLPVLDLSPQLQRDLSQWLATFDHLQNTEDVTTTIQLYKESLQNLSASRVNAAQNFAADPDETSTSVPLTAAIRSQYALFTLRCNDDHIALPAKTLERLRLIKTIVHHFQRSEYTIKSSVSPDEFFLFANALDGNNIEITEENCTGLESLCVELGFAGLDKAFEEFYTKKKKGTTVGFEEEDIWDEGQENCEAASGAGAEEVDSCGAFRSMNVVEERARVERVALVQKRAKYIYATFLIHGYGGPQDVQKGLAYMKQAAESGDTHAQWWLGRSQLSGGLMERNEVAGFQYFKKAADYGHREAHFWLGRCYEFGIGVQADMKQAIDWYRKGTLVSDYECAFKYGMALVWGLGVEKNLEEALKYLSSSPIVAAPYHKICDALLNGEIGQSDDVWQLKMAADMGDISAQCEYGIRALYGKGMGVNLDDAGQYLKLAADQGDWKAQLEYSHWLFWMNRLPESDEYCRKAADAGYDNAQTEKAMTYRYEGIDPELAVKYLERYAQAGNSEAMYCYATALRNGMGTPLDMNKARLIYKKAADRGNAPAMLRYAQICLYYGYEHEDSVKEAIRYYKMAADCGVVKACVEYFNLVSKYSTSPSEKEEGLKYLKDAAEMGHHDARLAYAQCLLRDSKNSESEREAVQHLKKVAETGDQSAIYLYGQCLEHGRGVEKNPEAAFRCYKETADRGYAKGLFATSMCYRSGIGCEPNPSKALEYMKRAADCGSPVCQTTYGWMCRIGVGGTRRLEEAACYFKKAADQGYSTGANFYGRALQNGEGVQQNLEEAAKYFKMAADNGLADSQVNYGICLKEGRGVQKNLKEAVRYFEMAAKAGNTEGQTQFGHCLRHGYGVKQDIPRAANYFKLAADNGSASAQFQYALLADHGEIPENLPEAAAYYKRAADRGIMKAQYNYAFFLMEGRGIPKNEVEAVRYYEMAANHGYMNAQFKYAVCLERGIGCSVDLEKAASFFKLAAMQGYGKAELRYGQCLENGRGVEKNLEEALEFYVRAMDHKERDAIRAHKELSRRMFPRQLRR